MATYIAFLDDNNLVTQVVQSPDDGQDWVRIYGERNNCRCLTTAIDGSIRNRFAQSGYTYHKDIDSFMEPPPYPSWVLNKTAKRWEAPVAMPDDELIYQWNETKQNWSIVWDPIWDTQSFPGEK